MRFDRYVALFGAALLLASVSPAAASGNDEKWDRLLVFEALNNPYSWLYFMQPAGAPNLPSGQAAAGPTVAQAATFHLENYGATLEAGEPNPGGLMTRTLWGGFSLPQASRVVIHTVGSDIFNTSAAADMDTVLAAYRGSTLASLTLVASNDNRSIPGFGSKQSLIQFNAAANTPYRIQIGAKAER